MNPLDKAVDSYIEAIRDARRPPIELVLEVIQGAFTEFQILATLVQDGSDGSGTWMWEDKEMGKSQLPKFYILTKSNSPGVEGYPMVTIRQAYSVKLDTWVTMSSIIPGPDIDGISRSLALLIAQHAGAFAGVRYCAAACVANGGHPHAGILAISELMAQKPPVYADVDGDVAAALGPEMKEPKEVN